MTYWIGTSVFLTAVFEKAWSQRFEPILGTTLAGHGHHLTDGSVRVALEFWVNRFMYGIAVLARDVAEQTWLTLDLPLHPDDHTEARDIGRRMLQLCFAGRVTIQHVAEAIPELRHAAIIDSRLRQSALQRLLSIWEMLQLRDVGAIRGERSCPIFCKRSWWSLSAEAKTFLKELRVPAKSFGFAIVQATPAAAAPAPDGNSSLSFIPDVQVLDGEPAQCPISEMPATGAKTRFEHKDPQHMQIAASQTNCSEAIPNEPFRNAASEQVLINSEIASSTRERQGHSMVSGVAAKTIEPSKALVGGQTVVLMQPAATVLWHQEQVQGGMLSSTQISQRLRGIFREKNLDVRVNFGRHNRNSMRHRVVCQHTNCPVTWVVTYITVPSPSVPAGQLTIWQTGQHEHDSHQHADNGRVWTAAQHNTALEYLRHATSAWTARDLTRYLLTHGHAHDALPDRTQRSEWLKRQRRGARVSATPRERLSVDDVDTSIAALTPYCDSLENKKLLCLLPGTEVSADGVYIPFSSVSMLSVLDTFCDSHILLGTDGKLRMLNNGWRVLSLGLLHKRALGRTTYAREVFLHDFSSTAACI